MTLKKSDAEIFISYSWVNESDKIATEIDNAFSENGILIVRDKRDVGYKANIDEFMDRIGGGKYIILVISHSYLTSRNCFYELVKIAENSDFYDRVFPVVLSDAKIYEAIDRLDYTSYWNNRLKELNEKVANSAQQGVLIADEIESILRDIKLFKRFKEEVDRLTDTFRKMNTLSIDTLQKNNYEELKRSILYKINEDNIKQPKNQKSIYNSQKGLTNNHLTLIPQYDYRLLIDRIDIKQGIKNELSNTNEIVLLSGIGGIGKTTIALAYCNNPENTKIYDNIAWVTVTNDIQTDLMNSISSDIIKFDYKDYLNKEENFNTFISLLAKIKGKCLLVIDNVNNYVDILNNKIKLEYLRWDILVTSRAFPDECKILDIEELELQHCRELFLRYYKKADRDFEVIDSLLKHVNYHTLLVELLAKTGNKNPLLNIHKLNEIIERQDRLKEPILQKKITITNPHTSQQEIKLFDYILALFDTVKLNDSDKQYLRFFSILPSIEIPFLKLQEFFQISDDATIKFIDNLDDLVKKGWLICNGDSYKMHNLIQVVIKEKLLPNYNNCTSLIEYFKNQSMLDFSVASTNPLKKKNLLPFLESILLNISDENISLSMLNQSASTICNSLGVYEESHRFALSSLKITEKHMPHSNELAHTYNVVGISYKYLQQYDKSIEYHLKSLKLFTTNLSKDHFKIGVCNNLLSISYRWIKNYDESIRCSLVAISNFQQNFEEYSPRIASAYNNIGITYEATGDFNKSLEYHAKAIEIRQQIYEMDSPFLAETYYYIASSYHSLKIFDKALHFIEKSYEIRKSILPDNHPHLKGTIELLNKIKNGNNGKNTY